MVAPDVPLCDDSTQQDSTRQNLVGVLRNTGTYLNTLTKSNFTIVVANDTSAGYTKDHVYLFAQDGTTKIDLSAIGAHTHVDSNTGGPYLDILGANNGGLDLLLTKTDDLKKAQWIETVTGTGTIEDKTDGTTGERSIRLRPNGTSGSGATISYPHLKLDFSSNAYYTAKLQIETASSLALHSGVGADDITAADSNTRKFNAEVCTATNNNWFLRTANGSANSSSDTGIAMTANRVSIVIKHLSELGTPETDLYVDSASVFQKTSNIPTSGATADINLIKHSIKNSTGADRPLLMYGCRLSYFVSDAWIQP